jgi:hypothetical protein
MDEHMTTADDTAERVNHRPAVSPTNDRAARSIRVMLAARNIRSTRLAEVLGLDRQVMRRRLLGTTAWQVAELDAAAEYFEMSVSDLLAAGDHLAAVSA